MDGKNRRRTMGYEAIAVQVHSLPPHPPHPQCCSNVHVMSLRFYERPLLVSICANRKESKFLLLRKKGNGKIPLSFGFATSCYRCSVHPSSKSGPAKLLPCELHSAYQHQVSIALNCVCEHLCFISVYFVHPLARCIVR